MSEEVLVRLARELGDNMKYLEHVPDMAYDYITKHPDVLNKVIDSLKHKASAWDIEPTDDDYEGFISQGINNSCIQSQTIKKWNDEQG